MKLDYCDLDYTFPGMTTIIPIRVSGYIVNDQLNAEFIGIRVDDSRTKKIIDLTDYLANTDEATYEAICQIAESEYSESKHDAMIENRR